MADGAPVKKGGDSAREQKTKRVLKLVQLAEIDRNRHINRIQDCYKYGMPWRHKANQNQPTDQLDEIFDEELMTVLEDFSADMLNTFTPQKSEWVEPKPVQQLDAGDLRQLAKPLAAIKEVIFAEMARSNFYQAAQECYLDLGPGTMCMVILDIDPSLPIHCEAIPAVDLLLNRGAYGRVDGIWRKRRRLGEEVKTLWPYAKLPKGQTIEDAVEYEVTDGVYRDHGEKAAETWQYCVVLNAEIAFEETYSGKGSNPFIVARWSRDATTAWGMGPTYKTLPAVKTLNHYRFISLKNYDKEADPTVSYEDDGVINLDNGIGPGEWVPRAPGSKAPEVIESRSRMDVQVFQIDEVRSAIRRAHYQDRPEQQGKTPPTATQWADEAAERARRMGTPATNLVIEWQFPIFERFNYLLTKRGKLPKVKLNDELVALEPISPLLRAQEQEEVVRMDKFVELLAARFGPEMVNIIVDQFEFAQRVGKKMGIAPQVVRTPEAMMKAVEQLAPVLGGGGGEQAGPPAAA